MRLLSCHIENYGKWSNKDIPLTDGINEFFMNNGEGKTTLASFIKAMFYGLKGYTDNTKEFVERRHFAPFGGGIFGGNICFELNGKQYVIERRFHIKTKARDEFTVLCNGSITDELGADPIGLQIFGLDEESFTRTLFITAEDMELCATEGISGSLNSYGIDKIDMKRTEALITAAIKRYKPLRGSGAGLIHDSEEKIKQYRIEIENLEQTDKALEEKYRRRAELTSNICELEKRASASREAEVLRQKWQNYDRLALSAKEAEEGLIALNEKYPRGIPSDADISVAEQNLTDFYRVSEKLSDNGFGEEKEKRLSKLNAMFSAGEPNGEEISDIHRKIDAVKEYSAKIAVLEDNSPNEREKELMHRFENGVPSDDALAEIEMLADDYRQKSARLAEYSMPTNEGPKASKISRERKELLILFALIGAAFVAVGIALAFAVFLVIGIIAVAVGAVTLVGVGFAYIVGRMNDIERERPKSRDTFVAVQLDMQRTELELKALLAPYGYMGADGVLSDTARLKDDIEVYSAFIASEQERRGRIQALRSECAKTESEIRRFFYPYGLDVSNTAGALSELGQMIYERRMLADDKKKSDDGRSKDMARLCVLNDELDIFFASYRDSMPDEPQDELNGLRSDGFKIKQYTEALNKARLAAEEYVQREKLSERPSGICEDISALEVEISDKREASVLLDKQIAEDEDDISRLDTCRSLLEKEMEVLNEYREKRRLLEDCKQFLKLSDMRLTERYITPVRDSFFYYASAVEETFGETVTLDRELHVRFEKNGVARDYAHLSTGQRAVWALCLRLAFIDRIFNGELPFMILDDPFVSLDADNMAGVTKLLKRLSENRQIIYFCCHGSRSIHK